MGGVAVLHPQDVLKDRLNYNRSPLISNSRVHSPNFIPDSNSTPKSISNSNRRKRSPQKKPNDIPRSPPLKSSNLVMGKVKILKRGEALTKNQTTKKVSFEKEKIGIVRKNIDLKENYDLESIELLMRLGPEPEMVPKQIHLADFYAGSAFVASPPPSSVPVPGFFKKSTSGGELELKNDEYASSDLRRLLKLQI